MSRGFVKEDDLEHAGTDVPERPISAHANYVTANGYAQLQAQLQQLEISKHALQANRDAVASQQQFAVINRDLRYVAARLETALLTIPDANARLVLFGAGVTVEDEAGVRHSYSIVGEDEADIKANKIAYTSPLAKALIGHKIEETVVWLRPAGDQTLTIVNIEYL